MGNETPKDGQWPSDASEQGYIQGRRAALIGMARHFIHELGDLQSSMPFLNWYAEREEIVACLRRICEAHGDNDWPDELRLVDVLEKHLERHLQDKEGST
ncbi:MAG: hypothetical protein WC683_18505 [bacterium]